MKIIRKKRDFVCDGAEYTLIDDNGKICASLKVETCSDYYEEFSRFKVLYLHSFSTIEGERNKGYGRKLLTNVISCYKGKYDMIFLQCCPYYHKNEECIYLPPSDGLPKDKLIKFYKSCGFRVFKKQDREHEFWTPMILIY